MARDVDTVLGCSRLRVSVCWRMSEKMTRTLLPALVVKRCRHSVQRYTCKSWRRLRRFPFLAVNLQPQAGHTGFSWPAGMVDIFGRRLRREVKGMVGLACFQSTRCSAAGQARVADSAGSGREFFVGWGSRILRE